MDGWIEEAGSTPDREKRRAAYQKIADAMREDVLNIPVLNFTEGSAYSTKMARVHREHLGVLNLGL